MTVYECNIVSYSSPYRYFCYDQIVILKYCCRSREGKQLEATQQPDIKLSEISNVHSRTEEISTTQSETMSSLSKPWFTGKILKSTVNKIACIEVQYIKSIT